MKKVIAILTQKGSLSKGLENGTTLNIFKLENEKVAGVETIKLEDTTNSYFSLLIAIKDISMLYVDSLGQELVSLLIKLGVSVRFKNEINNDNFISHFIFD